MGRKTLSYLYYINSFCGGGFDVDVSGFKVCYIDKIVGTQFCDTVPF